MILVVVGLSIVAVTLAVVAEPDKPATEHLWNLRARLARRTAVVPAGPAPAGPSSPAVSSPAAAPTTSVAPPVPAERRGERYQPPRWWQRLRSMVLLVIVTVLVGATVAAIVGVVLALLGLGVREAVS